jgi:hypothetical protein
MEIEGTALRSGVGGCVLFEDGCADTVSLENAGQCETAWTSPDDSDTKRSEKRGH